VTRAGDGASIGDSDGARDDGSSTDAEWFCRSERRTAKSAAQDRTHISLVGTAFLRGQSRGEASEQAGWRAAAATPVPGRSSVLRVGERAELS